MRLLSLYVYNTASLCAILHAAEGLASAVYSTP